MTVNKFMCFLSLLCMMLCGCGNSDDNDSIFTNNVTVIDVDGFPVSGQIVTLFDQTLNPFTRSQALTDEQGIAILEYEEPYLPTDFNYAFIVNGTNVRDPCGYVPFSGPDRDHTIVVDKEEVLTIDILNHDFETEQFRINDTILIDMIFHSTSAIPSTYNPRLGSPFAYINVLKPDGNYVDHRGGNLKRYIKNDGTFSLQFIPVTKDAKVDLSYDTKDREPRRIIYSLNIQ